MPVASAHRKHADEMEFCPTVKMSLTFPGPVMLFPYSGYSDLFLYYLAFFSFACVGHEADEPDGFLLPNQKPSTTSGSLNYHH